MDERKDDYDFGSISFYGRTESSENVFSMSGWSRESPVFINDVDKMLWNKRWHKKAEEKDVRYIEGQSRFSKEAKFGYMDGEEFSSGEENLKMLLGLYCEAAVRYNKQVAAPVISERSGLLDRIIG
ncbi:hypothetical protein HNV12_01295 [Methanococcoides sp. SA1]|nr:hypothetical protein [Methanococcoides sp. SA1]